MISLVEREDVEKRLGLPSMPEADDTLGSAIKAAHLRVQSILDTKFDQEAQTDIFLLDRDMCQGKLINRRFRLRLRHGLVLDNPAPAFRVAYVMDDLAVDGAYDVPLAVKIDYERGFVSVPDSYEGQYLQVDYTHGFTSLPDGSLSPTPPEALTEGIISYVPVVLEFSVKTSSVGAKIADQNRRASAAQHNFDVLAPLMRQRGLTLDPVY